MSTRRGLLLLTLLLPILIAATPGIADAQASWTHQFGTASDDFAFAVAVDALGVYSAGYTGNLPVGLACSTNTGNSNSFIRQYDPITSTDTTLATGNFEIARGLAVYAEDVYSAGLNQGTGTGVVRKAGLSGWTDLWPNPSQAFSIAVNGTGIYAGGFIIDSGNVQAAIRKYNFAGVPQWTEEFGTSSDEVIIGLALDGTS